MNLGRYAEMLSTLRRVTILGLIIVVLFTVFVGNVGAGPVADHPPRDKFILTSGTIRGIVYQDRNRNERLDGGEPSLAGARVWLTNEAGETIRETWTGPDGAFSFSDLGPGYYVLWEEDPEGYSSRSPNSKSIGLDLGEEYMYHFGDVLDLPGFFPVIAGMVFEDLNCNGEPDEGEMPLAGAVISLWNATGDLIGTRITDETGWYAFEDLPTGPYRLQETNPEGYDISTTPDEVGVVLEGPMPVEVHFGDMV